MSEPGNKPRAPTSDAIRAAIDAGKGTDKVDFPDPAAAPLGTDDEAGGHPPTPEQRRMAAASELRRPTALATQQKIWPYILLGIILVAIMVFLAIR